VSTLIEVKDILTMLCRSKPGTNLNKIDLGTYHAILEPIPGDVLKRAAIVMARQSGSFPPSAGDLYQKALDLMDDSPDVGEAWALVLRKARGEEVDLPERVARAAALIGGTRGWMDKDVDYKRREFAKAYERAGREWRERASLPGAEFKALPERSGT